MQKIYLICGVPGSGKSWVCEQLKNKYDYVRHDNFIDRSKEMMYAHIANVAKTSMRSVLVDCPFAEREMRDTLKAHGCEVEPVFIVEAPEVVKARYEQRMNKPVSKSTLTRAVTINERADEWKSFKGTSNEVLNHLRKLT